MKTYKKIDKFLNAKLPIKMMPATTWRDWIHSFVLDTALRGEIHPKYNYHGIKWRTHLADAMQVDGGMRVISPKTGKVLEKPFAKYFEKVLDRIFYETEGKKLDHFAKLFNDLPGDVGEENRRMSNIFAGSVDLKTGHVALGIPIGKEPE